MILYTMLYNTTYKNNDIKNAIDAIVGKPYSFLDRIKLKRVGSQRMIVEEVSPKYYSYLNTVGDVNYINIELRPKGILVHLTQALNRFSWPIAYHYLSIFDSNLLSIHAQGNYIKIRKDDRYNSNLTFIKKILALKSNMSNHFYE
ncbi:hypothetical protein ACXGQW_02780 [Wenyingzhuangia sp. IMCC45533]